MPGSSGRLVHTELLGQDCWPHPIVWWRADGCALLRRERPSGNCLAVLWRLDSEPQSRTLRQRELLLLDDCRYRGGAGAVRGVATAWWMQCAARPTRATAVAARLRTAQDVQETVRKSVKGHDESKKDGSRGRDFDVAWCVLDLVFWPSRYPCLDTILSINISCPELTGLQAILGAQSICQATPRQRRPT